MRLIADGVVDREGVEGLGRRLGYSPRHLHRQLVAVAGAGPLALARAQRAHTARLLLETTDVPITQVAFASGFQSVRQFNATVRDIFALTPGDLRTRVRRADRPRTDDAVVLRLPHRAPFDGADLIAFLGRRAVPGVEEVVDGVYRRSLRLPHGSGTVELSPGPGHVQARYRLDDLRDLSAAVQRCRALLDLDSDPHAVVDALGSDSLLGPLVRAAPGRRVPGHVDGNELALRAVLGQQVSLASAATLAGRLVAAYGERLTRPVGGVTHLFPSVAAVASASGRPASAASGRPASAASAASAGLAMPERRAQAVLTLARTLASSDLTIDAGADREETLSRLLALPGIGPWTVNYIAMRALRDPDAFLASDLGVRHALESLGQASRPVDASRLAERWRPYRAYATLHLWGQLGSLSRAKAA
jgi:AraC family transcriptional regulator of adaptative response / DNA-3-methyladenine glycosylase II